MWWLVVAGTLLLASPVSASVHIISFSTATSTPEAGGHPDFSVRFVLTGHQSNPSPCDCNDAKDVTAHLPAGLIGNPHATPQCDIAKFASDECPPDSQVGVTEAVVAPSQTDLPGGGTQFISPLFNLVPPPSEPGLLGFKTGLFDTPTFEVVSARTNSDYGLDVKTASVEHFAPLTELFQVTWGVPAAPIHNGLRFGFRQTPFIALFGGSVSPLCDANANPSTTDPATVYQLCFPELETPFVGAAGELSSLFYFGEHEEGPGYPVPSESPLTPFTQNPTTCGENSLSTSLDVLAYDEGETHANSTWPPTTDCAQLTFNPSLFAHPTTEAADSPSGIDVDLKAPLFESPSAPSPSEIRGTTVTLPPGFTINPSAADGKTSCTDAQARFGTTEEARCPEFAKIGTLEVHSPVLPGVLPGAIYIGKPLPSERYRLFIAFDGFGVHVKLPGSAHPDPQTGQLVTEFRNLPQFPFEDFDLHFFGAEHGILATPTRCGAYPVTTEFEPWDAALPDQTSTQFFTLDSGPNGSACPNGPRPFAPGFKAASATNTAGSHTAFSLDLTRQDGEQNLSALNVTTPPGFSASLKGVPYCPEPAIAAAATPGYSGLAESEHPSCPAASLVGEAIAGAGAAPIPSTPPARSTSPAPTRAPPSASSSSPRRSPAPMTSATFSSAPRFTSTRPPPRSPRSSDPLPQILEGIPLRLRSILVNLNRPDSPSTRPTANPLSVQRQGLWAKKAPRPASPPLPGRQLRHACLQPKLTLSLKGKTTRADHPALTATLTMPQGGANIARARSPCRTRSSSTRPTSTRLHPSPVRRRRRPRRNARRARSTATPARTPPCSTSRSKARLPALLRPQAARPRRGPERPDPDRPRRQSTPVNGGIRNTFEVVPDAPVTKFTLEMQGGARACWSTPKTSAPSPSARSPTSPPRTARSPTSTRWLPTPAAPRTA